MKDISYLFFTYSEETIPKPFCNGRTVPANVRAKTVNASWLSVKKRRCFYESQLGTQRTVLFECENKEGYIHGFTEVCQSKKTPWNPNWPTYKSKI
jgi:threonylcarbamoyladenosine tRNA methylthiotransferase MtaB